MSVLSTLNNWEKRFSWSLLGFVLAVFFGSLTIYIEFFKVSGPNFSIEVLGETNVLSFNEDVKELKVLWGDIDIKNLEKTISVVNVRVKNSGDSSLLKEFYDSDYPVYFSVENARVMEVELVTASSEYLVDRVEFISLDSKVILPEVILDSDSSYTFKVLLLHDYNYSPLFSVSGKIAGISELRIEKVTEESEVGLWSEAFSGNLWVQLIRVPSYFFIFLFATIVFFVPILFVQDYFSKLKRKRAVNRFVKSDIVHCADVQESIFSLYIDDGIEKIEIINDFILNKSDLTSYVEDSEKYLSDEYRDGYYSHGESYVARPAMPLTNRENKYKEYRTYSLVKKSGIVEVSEDNVAKFKDGSQLFISDFIKFIKVIES
ncbi:hypothetical protein [Vibrio fortis]|uniref:hypothetical protein n=1 Tax=Vibrio fortis TaxID=212667 RepID=UPI0038CD91A6